MAYTIDRRSEGKNSTTKQAKASRFWRKKNEANGMCVKCGIAPVGGGKKTCPSCVDRSIVSQRKSHFRSHLAEHGIPKDELGAWADAIHEIRQVMKYKPVQNLLDKHGTCQISDYESALERIVSALDAAVI